MIENITFDDELYAIIIRNNHSKDGVEFFTPENSLQQLGYMKHAKGHKIQAHIHKPFHREINQTSEILIIKSGKLKVNFYSLEQNFLASKTLFNGDVILLLQGGHGFECLEQVEMIAIKQGPFAKDEDKIRF